jgi:hypothetical protein
VVLGRKLDRIKAMKKLAMKAKENSVTLVRNIRDNLSRKIKDMTFEEQKEYLKKAKVPGKKPTPTRKAHYG